MFRPASIRMPIRFPYAVPTLATYHGWVQRCEHRSREEHDKSTEHPTTCVGLFEEGSQGDSYLARLVAEA